MRQPGRTARPGLADLPSGWRLTAAEHAAEAMIVTDLDGLIRYVNPAFERISGLPRECVLGQDVRKLPVFEQPGRTIARLTATIRCGKVWTGEISMHRGDGTRARTAATVAPVRNRAEAVVGGVAILRDTSGCVLETRLDEYRRERTALAEALGATRSGDTAEATAGAIGSTLLGLSGFGGVGLVDFVTSGEIVVLAALDRDGRPIELPGSLPTERSAYLRERASRGPWIEDWRPAPNHPYRDAVTRLGIDVLAYVPIRSAHDVLGLLVVSGGPGDELDLIERLPALVETAAFAGALLGPQLRSRSAGAVCEARIRAIIADRGFMPVFQPIVDLTTRVIVGYEALTRFADGSRPDEVFADAARCDLGIELEAATLAAILDASGPLPATAWLNLNVSAELVLAGEPLASLLRRWGSQIVLELTEHIQVTDYPALRAALERLGPNVRLAVDDAGAGFASLRHILELRPDYVKLDRGIVRQIHRDPARQALVAGMVQFVAKTEATLVAEGVETEAEARQLQRLGVALGQGYRLGRPVLAERIAGPPASSTPPVGPLPGRSRSRPAATRPGSDDIGRAVNVGSTLTAALRAVGVATVADLRALGAIPAWERLRQTQPRLATAATLLQLEGATRGITVSQLSHAERARHRLFVRLGRTAS